MESNMTCLMVKLQRVATCFSSTAARTAPGRQSAPENANWLQYNTVLTRCWEGQGKRFRKILTTQSHMSFVLYNSIMKYKMCKNMLRLEIRTITQRLVAVIPAALQKMSGLL